MYQVGISPFSDIIPLGELKGNSPIEELSPSDQERVDVNHEDDNESVDIFSHEDDIVFDSLPQNNIGNEFLCKEKIDDVIA